MESNGFDISFKRRNRGKSMRVAMITLLVTLIVVPTTLCVVLLFRISSLQNEINELMESHSVVADNNSSTDGALSDGETTSSTEEQSSTDEITTEIPTETTTVEPLPDGKYAYLTFDDGPSANTEAILDVLDQYGVKATFFVNGHTGSTMEARYKAIVDRGHALGIHTYTHKIYIIYNIYLKYLYDITGVDVRLFRFPGGSSNTIVDDITPYIQWINDNGYSYHDWNCSSGDADSKKPTAQQIIDNCMVQVDQGYRNLVILMHDTKSKDTTVEALPMLIEKLLENGYEIRAIDERSVPVHHREIEAE